MSNSTIFALSSGAPPSGVAVIRISGPQTPHILLKLTDKPLPKPRYMELCDLKSPLLDGDHQEENRLDQALIVFFPKPHSFTGEDMAELHCHGGLATIEAITYALQSFEETRQAEPGEFTRRAFQNGKMDLTAVEGLADLINAQSENQRRQALRQADGALNKIYQGWAKRLVRLLAHHEALIDFSDDEIPQDLHQQIKIEKQNLINDIKQHLNLGMQAQKTRTGLYIAIFGPPNVGKSSLLNFLLQYDRAIVSDSAGTTRDALYTHLIIADTPITLIDTAGIRETKDDIEMEGILRAKRACDEADLCILMQSVETDNNEVADKILQIGEDIIAQKPVLKLINKVDLLRKNDTNPILNNYKGDDYKGAGPLITISLKDEVGLDNLIAWLESWVKTNAGLSQQAVMTRPRHRHAIEACLNCLIEDNDGQMDMAIEAESIREAIVNIGRVTGKVDIEQILDNIFSEFCIGK